jgi:hypothetical protein
MIFKLFDMEITPTPIAWSPVTALAIALRCSKSGLYKQALGIPFSTSTINQSAINHRSLSCLSALAVANIQFVDVDLG